MRPPMVPRSLDHWVADGAICLQSQFNPVGEAAMSVATIGLFGAPADFRSLSMSRYALSLGRTLREFNDDRLIIQEVSPSAAPTTRRIAGRTPLFRYWVRYPRYLHEARSTTFAVNHILDQAYGHLTYALNTDRTIVTCHDLFPLLHWRGDVHGVARRRKRPVTVELSVSGLRSARFVIADSEATKQDLINVAKVKPGAIRVIPPGIDPAFRPLGDNEIATADTVWPLGSRSTKRILCIDTGGIRKNRRAMLEVFARVRSRVKGDICLVRVGPALEDSDLRHVHRLGIERNMVHLNHVPEQHMPLLYNSCDLLLFPSLFEGFGWPPLEAMACGTPVVSSRAAAIEEVAGAVALTADAGDYDGLAELVLRVLEDRKDTEARRARGLVHANTFSWVRTAREITKLYHTILCEAS
jgi:glycosyltransferase involved in cell wall biosynthesis